MRPRKTTAAVRAPGRAARYSTTSALRAATLAFCLSDWQMRHPGEPWSDDRRRGMRAALDEDLTDIPDAHRALVDAFQRARDVVKRRRDDPRVAALREFLGTLSDKTEKWLGHFADHMALGWNVAPSEGRTRLVLYELSAGQDADPGRLARLSLLLGYFPRDVGPLPATVASVVDRERKAFVQATKRAWKLLAAQRLERVARR